MTDSNMPPKHPNQQNTAKDKTNKSEKRAPNSAAFQSEKKEENANNKVEKPQETQSVKTKPSEEPVTMANKPTNNQKKALEAETPSDMTATTEQVNIKTTSEPITAVPKQSAVKSRSGFTLSIIAIVLVIGLGAGSYYHAHQQFAAQQQVIDSMHTQLESMRTTIGTFEQTQRQFTSQQAGQTDLKQQITNLVAQNQQQQQKLKNLEGDITTQANQFHVLQNKLSSLSTEVDMDDNLWLISQADFLINQASYKLRNEGDIVTTEVLLRSADVSLAEANEPQLADIRKAIAADISVLAAIPRIDVDGITLKLNQLSADLDQLPVLKLKLEDPFSLVAAEEDLTISDSVSDWKENLTRSWKGFMKDFISVTPRQQSHLTDRPELSSNQSGYLRENIRLQLLLAAQAVNRGQQTIYQQSLNQAINWVKLYYDPDNQVTQAFINQLTTLTQQQIHIDLPSILTSQPLIKKVMQSRVKKLMTQRSTNPGQEG